MVIALVHPYLLKLLQVAEMLLIILNWSNKLSEAHTHTNLATKV